MLIMASNVKTIFIFFASFIVCSYSFASYDDYQAAYEKKDYKSALALLMPLVDKGDDRANYALCLMYAKGQGVPTDYTKADDFCMKSALNGYAKAQYMLGVFRHNYMYTKESRELVNLPSNGALSEDMEQAEVWFKKAAAQGHVKAIGELCNMYSKKADESHSHYGGSAYYSDALYWCTKSALLENNSKNWFVIKVAKLYSEAGDYKSSMEWYKKYPDAFGSAYAIGVFYRDGLGVSKDYEAAFEWFKKSADEGDVSGLHATAVAYLEGRGTKQDKSAGIDFLRKAAVYGGESLYLLGICYMNADGVQNDPVLAYSFIAEGFAPSGKQKEKEKYMAMLGKKLTKEQRIEVDEIRGYLRNSRAGSMPVPTSSKTGAGMRR
jgi:TPR repeat protein